MSPMKKPKLSVAANKMKKPKMTFSRFMEPPPPNDQGAPAVIAGTPCQLTPVVRRRESAILDRRAGRRRLAGAEYLLVEAAGFVLADHFQHIDHLDDTGRGAGDGDG